MDLDDEEREVLHNYNIMDILNMIRIQPGSQRRLKNDPIAMFDFNRKTDFINIISELLDTKFLTFRL